MAKTVAAEVAHQVHTTVPVAASINEGQAVAFPSFSTEEVQYTRIYFPDGKPSASVRQIMKDASFVFQPQNGCWFGETSKLPPQFNSETGE